MRRASVTLLVMVATIGTAAWDASALPPAYTIADMGAVDEGECYPYAINNLGEVAGCMLLQTGGLRAFKWTADVGFQELTGPAGELGRAYGLNEAGTVVGQYGSDACRWTAAGPESIGGYLGRDINDSGWIVGQTSGAACSWQSDGSIVTYDIFGASVSEALAVNSAGEMVGTYYAEGDDHRRGFFREADGTLHDIGYPEGWDPEMLPMRVYVWTVNSSGQAAVTLENTSAEFAYAYLWSVAGGFESLPTLDGWSMAWDANDEGAVVGTIDNMFFEPDSRRGWAWSADSGAVDLNDVILDMPEGWIIQEARAINDLGQIAGCWLNPDDPTTGLHGFVLTPIPEPATVALLGLGLTAMLARRRDRA